MLGIRQPTPRTRRFSLAAPPPQPLDSSVLKPGGVVLLWQNPKDVGAAVHPRVQGYKEQLAERHGSCYGIVTFTRECLNP